MKVSRVYGHEVLNRFVNMPEILPHVAPGFESYDLTEYVKNRENIVLRCGPALAIFTFDKDGIYDGHYLFPKEARGKTALTCAKNIISEMFTTYKATAIKGAIARENRAARVITRVLGFSFTGYIRGDAPDQVACYSLEREQWAPS